MKRRLPIAMFVTVALLFIGINRLFSQSFTKDDYKKALWMTTRFYGGQRSGLNNWLLNNHLPTGLAEAYRGTAFKDDKDVDGYDLSGGWHDCGDHVKFGQTEFYSAYMLLKGYAEFPTGYDDYYSANYANYALKGWSWEAAQHDPNGIPDVLDEVKHATDFFIKCTRDASTFYYQVGDGAADHTQWVTATKMQTLSKAEGGQARSVYKNPADASMASFCGATLALMSRVYRKFDPVYADLCLAHALYAYTYAKAHPGTVGDANGGSFYGANDNWKDDYADMCAELYWATNNTSYKTEALAFSISYAPGMGADIYGKNYGFDYTNNGDIAIYNLAKLGKSNGITVLEDVVNKQYFANVQADGQFNGGNTSWGPLRYNANTAFIVALWQKLKGTTATPNAYIYKNVDYLLGNNSSSLAFVVGFGAKSATFPHHRNFYLRDDNPTDAVKKTMTIPAKNAQFGVLVGGTRTPGSFVNDVVNYTYTEGGIDYNACLVGVLAYINSVQSPVDTGRFGHPTPVLGNAKTLCGTGSATITATVNLSSLKTGEAVTFKWFKGTATTPFAQGTTTTSVTVTTADTYRCDLVETSTGAWTTSGSVIVSAVLPTFSIGSDVALCTQTSDTLKAATGTGFTYTWKRNGTTITSATSNSYIAYTSGTYVCTINATGCIAKSDTAIITSSLPTVVNDTICKAGSAPLSVTSTGSFAWYNVATGGTVLATGSAYTPTITATSTYYVQDASSVSLTVAPASIASSLTGANNGGNIGIKFTASKPFTITSMSLLPYVYSCGASDKVSITLDLLDGSGTKIASYASSQVACTGTQSGTPFNTYYTVTFSPAISITAAGNYTLTPSAGNALVWFNGGANFTTISAAGTGVISITGTTRTDVSNNYPGMFDIKIQAGSSCGRAPVFAVIDATSSKCSQTCVTPTANAGSDVSVCSGKSTTLTATGGGQYAWSNGATTASVTVSPTATTTYVVTVTSATGSCFATDNVVVTVSALPTINAGSDVAICSGSSTSLSVTGGSSYAWSNGIMVSTNVVSPTVSTTYFVTGTNASGCSATDAVIVSVNTIPALPTVTTPVNYLLNATATALNATGTALKWYTVSTSGTALTSAPIPSTTATGTTNYYVSQTVNTCESSRATIVVNVTNNQLPTVAITAPANKATYTAPASITLTATASDPDGTIASVKFYNGTTLLSTISTAPYTYVWTGVAAGTYSITAVATDNIGGSTTSSIISVIVYAQQSITLNAGWNIVSFNVQPTDSTFATVFSTFGTNLLTIKTQDGFYDPSQPAIYNSIKSIEKGKAYLINVKTTQTLTVTGNLVGTLPISLKAGWNLVGYPKQVSGTINTVLTSIWASFTFLKNFDGFYQNGGVVNSLTNMIPNQGYFIKVSSACTLNY